MKSNVLLSLDGGGVRGIFILKILLHIQSYLNSNGNSLKLHETFSLMVGTSVGAIIASFLAFGMFETHNATELIVDNIADMFRNKNSDGPILEPLYNGRGKTHTIKKIFGERKLGDSLVPLVITTVRIRDGSALLFRSWDERTKDFLISDILDASTAAPIYFPPVYIENELLVDGGVLANDPALVCMTAGLQLFPSSGFNLLSIGTSSSKQFKFEAKNIKTMGILNMYTSGLIEILMGINSNIANMAIKEVIGDDSFMRISSSMSGCMDDVSQDFLNNLVSTADSTWIEAGDKLLMFLHVL